ncbi:exopolyphosphatase [Orbaceae bacterium ESL0721]|nr:exopolyphosphatase [Orbaceae bacterium ESL0721]
MNDFNEYAVIDLGSNSFHMMIARRVNGAIQIIYKNKQNIHLATGLNSKKELSDSSIKRGIDCLTLFAERLKGIPRKKVRIIATHTLRVAKNRSDFINAASKVLPYPIEVISGQEEARLIYLGMITSESTLTSDCKLIIDIGGGSTEIAVGRGFKPVIVESRPMGCITYAKQFFPDKKITHKAFYRAKLAAEQQMEALVGIIQKEHISVAFGTSGTIKSIYKILLDLGVSDGIITRKRLDDLVSYVLEFKNFNDIDYPSLSEQRKPFFVSGLAIFYGLFNVLGLKELHYCSSALREGTLYELIAGNDDRDIRENTAQSLAKQYSVDQKHADQVVKTAQHFFNQWSAQAPIKISKNLESILYLAAQLHEVGLNINFTSIHKHSSYILQNSNLPGFNEEQQLLLATLVRYYRKSMNSLVFPNFTLFEYEYIFPLLQIIRLATLINNKRTLDIDLNAFQLKIANDKYTKIVIEIDHRFIEKNRLILLDLEQEQQYWQATKKWELIISTY